MEKYMILSMLPEFSNEFEWKTKTNKPKIWVFLLEEKMLFMKCELHIWPSPEISYLIMFHNYRPNLEKEI